MSSKKRTLKEQKKRIAEVREERYNRIGERLQMRVDKPRTVSAAVLGKSEDKEIQLPKPRSSRSPKSPGNTKKWKI